MITFNGLPLYRATLATDGDGVVRVSLVDVPAVGSNFDVFRAQDAKAPALYAVQDEDRHLVRGVVLRADYPIYRKDRPEDPGYYVTFSADVIRQAAERLLAEGHANDVNLQHEDGSDVEGVQMVQFFLKDAAAGVDPQGFDGIADGSLFAEYHVTNEDVWAEIKAGTFRGFSVEIFYTLIPAVDAAMHRAAADTEAVGLFSRLISKITDMSKLEKLRETLRNLLTDGPAQEPAKMGSVTTDKGVIVWDGDEDLKAGDRVQVEDADGNRTDAADGDYTTGDGKVIVVVSGEVSEIRDPEAEVGDQDPDPDEDPERMAAQERKASKLAAAEKFALSYDEKMRRIAEAITAGISGFGDTIFGHLVDAGDDFAVFDTYGEWNDWADKYERYRVSWNGDEPSVSDPVEVRRAFVPMDFDDAAAFAPAQETASAEEYEAAVKAAEDFKAERDAARQEADTLKTRIAELEKAPAGTPAREKFNGAAAAALPESIGDKGLERLARPLYRK